MMRRTSGVEQLVPVMSLGVLPVLDLQPRGSARICLVRAVRPLRRDTLKVTLADRAEPVDLWLEHQVGMIERFWNAQQAHRTE